MNDKERLAEIKRKAGRIVDVVCEKKDEKATEEQMIIAFSALGAALGALARGAQEGGGYRALDMIFRTTQAACGIVSGELLDE